MKYLIAILFAVVVSLSASASLRIGNLETQGTAATSASPEADALWAQLAAMPDSWHAPHIEDDVERYKHNELRNLEYRELGLKFYDAFPADPRRWEWLLNTFNAEPQYWKDLGRGARLMASGRGFDAQVDQEAKQRWEKRFRAELQSAFFASPQVTAEQKTVWYGLQLAVVEEEFDDFYRRKKPATDYRRLLPRYLEALRAYAAHPAAEGSANEVIGFRHSGLLGRFHWLARSAELSVEEQKTALASLKQTSHPFMRAFAEGTERRLLMRDTPLEFQAQTFDGSTLDIASLRGKVVLVDLWSLSCSNCIEAMPGIRAVYDRYRDRGFEVVGLFLTEDAARENAKAGKILAKTGASAWTNIYVSGADYKETMRRFAIMGVPVTWLLGKDGRLVTDDIKGDKLEHELRRLLDAES